jgi:DNA topoisomerase VI subunit A
VPVDPGLATRALLHALVASRRRAIGAKLAVVGIFDYNPHGCHILCTYRYGSRNMPEAPLYCVPKLAWLGMLNVDITSPGARVTGPPLTMRQLTQRDRNLCARLQQRRELSRGIVTELQAMQRRDGSVELQEAMVVAGADAFMLRMGQRIVDRAFVE